MLTKGNVNFMVNNGMMDITAHTLDAAHAYKVVKFKNILRDINRGVEESEKSFHKELAIDDAFINRINELIKLESEGTINKKDKEELAKLRDTDKRFGEMRNAMLDEEANLSDVKIMPYEEWKKLQDENKDKKLYYRNRKGEITDTRELLMVFENELEGVLWKAPEE